MLRVGGLKGSVPGQSFLESGWRRAEDASGRVYYWHVHTRQTRWTPPVTGFEDENEEDEEDEEDEDEDEGDEDVDEIYAESRFPAGFLPMRMCRWFPSRNCRQGWWCMFAHSVNELHPLLVIKGPDIFVRSLVSGSHLFGVGLVRGVQDHEIFWEMTSGISCSILYLCLVRQRILCLDDGLGNECCFELLRFTGSAQRFGALPLSSHGLRSTTDNFLASHG